MKPLKVVVFLDGRPGHEKQSLGVVQAIQRRVAVDVREVTVSKQSIPQSLRDYLRLNCTDAGYGDLDTHGTDLYIGTGRATHLPLLLSKNKYGGKAVCCMTPEFYIRGAFDLCLVPHHDSISESSRIHYTFGAPNCSVNKQIHQESNGLILVGGIDEKSHVWSSEKVAGQIELIVKTEPKKWVVSSSPRTPKETVTRLRSMADKENLFTFFHYKDTPQGWVEEQCDKSKTVWVTADSISMVYEALSAGCNVGLLPVLWKKQRSKFQRSEQHLIEHDFVLTFTDWANGAVWSGVRSEFNEADKCADKILEKWWPERYR